MEHQLQQCKRYILAGKQFLLLNNIIFCAVRGTFLCLQALCLKEPLTMESMCGEKVFN